MGGAADISDIIGSPKTMTSAIIMPSVMFRRASVIADGRSSPAQDVADVPVDAEDAADLDAVPADDDAASGSVEDASEATSEGRRTLSSRPFVSVHSRLRSPMVGGALVGLLCVAGIAGLTGVLGYQAHQGRELDSREGLFLQAARQAALNLTTIRYTEVDADIRRVVDSSTGAFRDEFKKHAPEFADAVRQAQSVSEGSIVGAGIESMHGATAQVLVATEVKSALAGAPSQQPRHWRMRISVQAVDGGAKVSGVEFVT
jgi:Mce-associated membrane protein